MKLAIVTTHPIQYNAPLFRLLAKEQGLQIKVFYTWSQTQSGAKLDLNFGKVIEWDIPLLDEYEYAFIDNVAKEPGSHHFRGIDNPGLIENIEAWKPQCLLIFGWSFKSHLKCLRYFKGKVPILFRGDSTLLDDYSVIKKFLRKVFLTWVYQHIDYALYVGQHNKDYFKSFGLRNDQLIFAPHAIDNKRFGSDKETYQKAADKRKKELSISDKDLVILFAGKLEAKKDPALLIRLANALPEPHIKFLITGNGHLEEKLKADASSDKRIIFLDFQNQKEMPVIYRMSDIFILPSIRNETWGLAINEAMACGRPVISSDKVGCVPDLVIHGYTGWRFVPGIKGESELIKILNNIFQDRTGLKVMGENAYNKVQEYSYVSIIDSIKYALNKITKAGKTTFVSK